jgi:hypothetical protein
MSKRQEITKRIFPRAFHNPQTISAHLNDDPEANRLWWLLPAWVLYSSVMALLRAQTWRPEIYLLLAAVSATLVVYYFGRIITQPTPNTALPAITLAALSLTALAYSVLAYSVLTRSGSGLAAVPHVTAGWRELYFAVKWESAPLLSPQQSAYLAWLKHSVRLALVSHWLVSVYRWRTQIDRQNAVQQRYQDE